LRLPLPTLLLTDLGHYGYHDILVAGIRPAFGLGFMTKSFHDPFLRRIGGTVAKQGEQFGEHGGTGRESLAFGDGFERMRVESAGEDTTGSEQQNFGAHDASAEDAGDVAHGQILPIVQTQGGCLFFRKKYPDDRPQVLSDSGCNGSDGFGAGGLGQIDFVGPEPSKTSPLVCGQSGTDDVEPGNEATTGVVAVEASVGPQKGFLGQVLGVFRVAEAQGKETNQSGPSPPDQFLEGL
ncbi:uncharacterized protein METZ01_LOCUS495916, partial [marine metagenome]